MSDTITPTLNQIADNTATTLTVESPSVLAPPISERDAFAMDMGDLKKLAGIDQTAQSAPVAQSQPQTSPEYTLEQGPDGIQVRLSPEYGGEVFKGKDFNEVIAKLAKSKADGNAYIKQLKTQTGVQPDPMQAQQFPTDPALQQSPEEAQREAAQFVRDLALTPDVIAEGVAKVFGVDPSVLPQTVQGITKAYGEWQATNTMFELQKRCPDYLDTPDNAAALWNGLGEVPQGYAPNVDDLEAAYALGVYRGTIKPNIPQKQPVSIARPVPMPSSGGIPTDGGGSAWEMPLDQLARLAGISK